MEVVKCAEVEKEVVWEVECGEIDTFFMWGTQLVSVHGFSGCLCALRSSCMHSFFFAGVAKLAGVGSFEAMSGLGRKKWLGVSQMEHDSEVVCAYVAPVGVRVHTAHSHLPST